MLHDFIPKKYQPKWFWVLLAATAVLWAALVLSRWLMLHAVLSLKNLQAFLILAVGLAGLPAVTGFLGLPRCFLGGSLGNLGGLAAMFYLLARGGGWEDITSLLVLAEFSLAGWIVGLIWEVWRRLRRRFSLR